MLDHTPAVISERKSIKINPANICMPIGAAHAAAGLRNCMPHSHGSQGCSSYLRTQLTRHYREPVMGTSSSFSEDTAVFGGGGNLKQAIRNILAIYRPEVIAIHTTCVAETIGDDVGSIIEGMEINGDIPEGVKVIAASTPSYVGTHITGYARMVEAMASLAEKDEGCQSGRVSVIPGFNAEPGDIREIKRLLALMETGFIMFPDTSDTFAAPLTGELKLYPEGGTTIAQLRDLGNSVATFVLCHDAGAPAAALLQKKFDVPAVLLPTPIGITNVDRFLMELSAVTGRPIPAGLENERGRLVDMMHDAHPHFHGKRVAIAADPDLASGMAGLVTGLGMEPVHVLSGSKSPAFEAETRRVLGDRWPDANIVSGGDLFLLHQMIKNQPVDLILGNSHAKYIARAEDIPLIRIGFPISDRANLHHFPVMGYAGAARMVERIGNTLLERLDRDAPDEQFELLL